MKQIVPLFLSGGVLAYLQPEAQGYIGTVHADTKKMFLFPVPPSKDTQEINGLRVSQALHKQKRAASHSLFTPVDFVASRPLPLFYTLLSYTYSPSDIILTSLLCQFWI